MPWKFKVPILKGTRESRCLATALFFYSTISLGILILQIWHNNLNSIVWHSFSLSWVLSMFLEAAVCQRLGRRRTGLLLGPKSTLMCFSSHSARPFRSNKCPCCFDALLRAQQASRTPFCTWPGCGWSWTTKHILCSPQSFWRFYLDNLVFWHLAKN